MILDRGVEPFHDHLARPATSEEVEAWLTGAAPPQGARLSVGGLSLLDGAPLSLDAGGFDRHTFMCGQSGSGKSYSLGLILEQLLLETDLRMVILDPNSDFARLAEAREGIEPDLTSRWTELSAGIAVMSADAAGPARLRLRFGELHRRPRERCCGWTRSPTARSTPSSRRSWRTSGPRASPSLRRSTAPRRAASRSASRTSASST